MSPWWRKPDCAMRDWLHSLQGTRSSNCVQKNQPRAAEPPQAPAASSVAAPGERAGVQQQAQHLPAAGSAAQAPHTHWPHRPHQRLPAASSEAHAPHTHWAHQPHTGVCRLHAQKLTHPHAPHTMPTGLISYTDVCTDTEYFSHSSLLPDLMAAPITWCFLQSTHLPFQDLSRPQREDRSSPGCPWVDRTSSLPPQARKSRAGRRTCTTLSDSETCPGTSAPAAGVRTQLQSCRGLSTSTCAPLHKHAPASVHHSSMGSTGHTV